MTGARQATTGLGRRAARGAAITLGGQGLRIGVQLLSVTILARLLTPEDYGLLAMVLVIVGVGEVFRDFGLSSAAVQARELSRQQRDNLFWINTGIGTALAALVAGSAGAIADAYDRPALVGIAQALSLTFVVNGLATQYRADLLRDLRFAAVARADVVAPVLALAVAVTVALSGGGYWALVAQSLTQALSVLVGLVLSARWCPGRPRRGVEMRGLLAFGGRLVLTQLVGYASNHTDTLVVGIRFGAVPLGQYTRAFQLLMTPLAQLRAPTTTVALPVLSRLQEDQDRYEDFLRRGQLALGYTLVAGLSLAAAAAEPIVEVFLGPGWDGVAPILRLFAVAGALQTLAYVGFWVYLSRGLTAVLLRYSVLTACLKITCILVGSHWGVLGVATGYTVAHALEWPLSLWWLSRHATIPTRALVTGALRILAVAGASGLGAALVVQALDTLPDLLRLAAAALSVLVVYALGVLVLRPLRRDVEGVLDVVRMAKGAPRPRRG